jgi:hypothetical protein
MDALGYAKITELCRRLGGRLSDPSLDAIRVNYFVGELDLAEATLLIGLSTEAVAITRSELDLIEAIVADPTAEEVRQLRVVGELPVSAYIFSPTGPADAPDPAPADRVLATEGRRHHVRSLHRAWRAPRHQPSSGTWLHLATVDDAGDELGAYSALSSRLGVALQVAWPLEVVGGYGPTPYQRDALAAAVQV